MLINIDEVATGALINAISVAGRRMSVALGSLPRRRREHDLTVARWFATHELTRQPPQVPEALADILRGDEVQAALQELLAARLTNASENDAALAREVLRFTLGSTPEAAALAGYYDDEICALVARLEADDPPLLTQIRADAFATRITLREFAAKDPPESSVVGFIENALEALYQCSPPPGLVELLLLTGRAVVLFDGLDELLDTTRRRDVTDRVERFCSEYPHAPVLVTSRLIGYDQARLDDTQFTCYRLGRFGGEQVGDYVRKWFALDEDARTDDAEAFLAESASIPDLRSNPLLLFTRNEPQPAVTERELITATAEFLHGRGFESEDEAKDAAREFVGFCRGRLWVFSDAGTTAYGEKLYAFTHRTFLEYFAAEQLAFACDSPERLASELVPHVARSEWEVVGELAVQVKDCTSSDGAQRIFDTLIGNSAKRTPDGQGRMLKFLAICLRSVDPSPRCVRDLTRQIAALAIGTGHTARTMTTAEHIRPYPWAEAQLSLLEQSGSYLETVLAEIDAAIAEAMRSGDRTAIVGALLLFLSMGYSARETGPQQPNVDRFLWAHRVSVRRAAADDAYIAIAAVESGVITGRQALEMHGGIALFFEGIPHYFFVSKVDEPYLARVFRAFLTGWPAYGETSVVDDLAAVGQNLRDHPEPPWLSGPISYWYKAPEQLATSAPVRLGPSAWLGAAAIVCILTEKQEPTWPYDKQNPSEFDPLRGLLPYLRRRTGSSRRRKLRDLPVPEEFKQTFRDWAEGRIDFTAPARRRQHAAGLVPGDHDGDRFNPYGAWRSA
jgi:hypothetical protein